MGNTNCEDGTKTVIDKTDMWRISKDMAKYLT